jgi:hypothetical protein
MQSSNEIIRDSAQAKTAQAAFRPWTKPEAKTAEVAQVTLAGHPNFTALDFETCAS